jgi:hypothetical protein
MAIESTMNTLVLDEVMAYLLLEEVKRKDFESINESLAIHGISKEKGKKRENGRSKSRGRHKSPRKSKRKCWNCSKVEHFIRDCKEDKKKNKNEKNDTDRDIVKSSQEDGGDAIFVALATDAIQSAWLIDSGASFYMNSHQQYLSVYDKYDGGMVYIGVNLLSA